MSLKSIILSAKTRGDIKYHSKVVGAGSQLTKTWKIRHNNVPLRLNAISSSGADKEMLYYDAAKVFADFVMYCPFREGVSNHDRVYIGSRIFNVKKVDDWDLQGLYLKIALLEETNV